MFFKTLDELKNAIENRLQYLRVLDVLMVEMEMLDTKMYDFYHAYNGFLAYNPENDEVRFVKDEPENLDGLYYFPLEKNLQAFQKYVLSLKEKCEQDIHYFETAPLESIVDSHFETTDLIEVELDEYNEGLITLQKFLSTLKRYSALTYKQNLSGNKFLLINIHGEIVGYSEEEIIENTVWSFPLQPELSEMYKYIQEVAYSYRDEIENLKEDSNNRQKLDFLLEHKHAITTLTLANEGKEGYVSLSANQNFKLNREMTFLEEKIQEELYIPVGPLKPLDPSEVKDVNRIYYEIQWANENKKWRHKEFIFS